MSTPIYSHYGYLTKSVKVLRNFIGNKLELYGIEDRTNSEIRAILEVRLAQEWHTHNVSTIPDILHQTHSFREEGGLARVFEDFRKLESKSDDANKELGELVRFLLHAKHVRRDLPWEQAETAISAFATSVMDNRRDHYGAAVLEMLNLSTHMKVLSLPMYQLRSIVKCFKLPSPSMEHIDAAMQIISNARDVKAKCDAIIEGIDSSGNAQTHRSALLAIDQTWKAPLHVILWLNSCVKEQAAAFVQLQAIVNGSAYTVPEIRVPVHPGSVLEVNFQVLKDMCERSRLMSELCARGCRAYEASSSTMLKYIHLLRKDDALRSEMNPEMWATRDKAVFYGIMHKCFLQIVDPVRFLEESDYTEQILQDEHN